MPTTTRRAADLAPGDVITIGRRVIRTVDHVGPAGYEARNPVIAVRYRQGPVPGVWSGGNVFGRDEDVTVHVDATCVIDYLRCSGRCGYSVWLDSERPGDPCGACTGVLVFDHSQVGQ